MSNEKGRLVENSKQSFFLQYSACIIASLSSLLYGFHIAWITGALPLLQSDKSPVVFSSSEASTLVIMSDWGSIPGNLLAWYFTDKFGRKTALQFCAIPYFLTSVIYATLPYKFMYYLARFCCGFGLSATCTTLPAYLAEITTPKIRGSLSSLFSFQLKFGCLIEFILVTQIPFTLNAWIMSIIPVILFVFMSLMPESPYFYLLKNQDYKAKHILNKLNRNDEFELMQQQTHQQILSNWKYKDLFFFPTNMRILIIMAVFVFCFSFSGGNTLTTYCFILFQKVNSDLISADASVIILIFASLFGQIFAMYYLDRFKRKKILLYSTIAMGLCLFLLGLFFFLKPIFPLLYLNQLYLLVPVIVFSTLRFVASLGMETLLYVILGEIFPPNVKSFANCLLQLFLSVLNATSTKLYQIISDNLDVFLCFWIYLILLVIGLIVLFRILPETKGKSLEVIQQEIKNSIN